MREDSRRSHIASAVALLREHHLEIQKHFHGRIVTRKEYDISLNNGVFRKAGSVHCVGVDGQGILHGLNPDQLTKLCDGVKDSGRVLSNLTRHSAGPIAAVFQARSDVLRAVHDALPTAEQKAIHLSLNPNENFHNVVAATSSAFTTFYLAVLDHERKPRPQHSHDLHDLHDSPNTR